ncbi:MAG: redoxin family protein [Verrucomicrobiota bacterium]
MRALLLLLLTATLSAAELKVGDIAPTTRPEAMITGEAVQAFKKGEVYVFECWASWCGPCVATIPHLNQLHQQFQKKGVVIMGVNVWEAERNAEAAQKARDFVNAQGAKMSYRTALGGKAFIKDWLEAAGIDSIPHAFVIAEGKVAWIGHPAELNDEMLGDIITGTYAPKANRKASPNQDAEMERQQDKLDKLASAMMRKDWDAAEKALPIAAAVLPPEERQDLLNSVGAQIALARGDPTKAYAQIAKIAEEEKDDAETQNELAWDLVTNPLYLKKPDLALAERCAERAVKLSQEKEGDKLDTLARVRWLQGRKADAIKLQEKAVTRANSPDLRVALQKTLDALNQGILPKANLPEDEEK